MYACMVFLQVYIYICKYNHLKILTTKITYRLTYIHTIGHMEYIVLLSPSAPTLTMSTRLYWQAKCKGVCPRWLRAAMGAPLESRKETISERPSITAKCKTERPRSSTVERSWGTPLVWPMRSRQRSHWQSGWQRSPRRNLTISWSSSSIAARSSLKLCFASWSDEDAINSMQGKSASAWVRVGGRKREKKKTEWAN